MPTPTRTPKGVPMLPNWEKSSSRRGKREKTQTRKSRHSQAAAPALRGPGTGKGASSSAARRHWASRRQSRAVQAASPASSRGRQRKR